MSTKRRLQLGGAMLMTLAIAIFAVIIIACVQAHGQPTSAPASQPVAGWWLWLKAHWPMIVGVLVVVLPALITALARYPRAGGVVKALQIALDVLSWLTHRDSPGTLKVPLVMRSKPPAVTPPPTPRV
jgi:hypothetical protein